MLTRESALINETPPSLPMVCLFVLMLSICKHPSVKEGSFRNLKTNQKRPWPSPPLKLPCCCDVR